MMTAAPMQTAEENAFADRVERHRRELHVHCYRMLGSFEEAEDLVQETFLRAWRARGSFAGRSTFRAWLYRIATNACLDALAKRPRKQAEPGSFEVPWLQPYPDELLEQLPAPEDEPDALVVARETIELAYLVAVQQLPPRSRAVLIVRDVLGWSAKETAELLDTSVAAVNSALQRARATLKQHLPERRADWGADATEAERVLVQRYVEASERADAQALAELLTADVRFAMPPQPGTWTGRDNVVGGWVEGGLGTPELRDFRCLVTRANHQPAVAFYLRKPGDDVHRAMALDVLRIEDGAVGEIITFDSSVFATFGLPAQL